MTPTLYKLIVAASVLPVAALRPTLAWSRIDWRLALLAAIIAFWGCACVQWKRAIEEKLPFGLFAAEVGTGVLFGTLVPLAAVKHGLPVELALLTAASIGVFGVKVAVPLIEKWTGIKLSPEVKDDQ